MAGAAAGVSEADGWGDGKATSRDCDGVAARGDDDGVRVDDALLLALPGATALLFGADDVPPGANDALLLGVRNAVPLLETLSARDAVPLLETAVRVCDTEGERLALLVAPAAPPELAGEEEEAVPLMATGGVAAAVALAAVALASVGAPPRSGAMWRRVGAARTAPRLMLDPPLPSSIQLLVADGLGGAGTNEPDALVDGDGVALGLPDPLRLPLPLALSLGVIDGGPDTEGAALDVADEVGVMDDVGVMLGVMEQVGDALGEREGGRERLGLPLQVALALGVAPKLGLAVGLVVPDALAVWLGDGLALPDELGDGDGSAWRPEHGARLPPLAEGS